MSREFCPPHCNRVDKPIKKCSAPTYLSDGDRSRDRCFHLDDKVIDPPRPVEVKKTRTDWVDGNIVGENGDMFYVEEWGFSGKTRSVSGIQKNSPLIRRK